MFVIHLFTFSSSQTWHKPSLSEGIQICSFEGPCIPLYQRDEIAKIHLRHLKIFSRTTVPILINLGTKYPLAKGIHFHMKNYSILKKRCNDILLRLHMESGLWPHMTLSIETVSQVSYVVHVPLVNSAALISDVAYGLYFRCLPLWMGNKKILVETRIWREQNMYKLFQIKLVPLIG